MSESWLAAGAGCSVGELARWWAAGSLAGSRPTLPSEVVFACFAFIVFFDPLSLHQS